VAACFVSCSTEKKASKAFKLGKYQTTIGLYQKVLNSNPNNARANYYVGESYRLSNRLKEAEQFYARLDQYLPGLWRNHSLVLQGAWQQRDNQFNYSFTDNFVYARGYNTPLYTRIYKLGANYHLPIAYPDWGFAQLLYFSRIRANLFYDYSMANFFQNNFNTRYTSAGTELYFDTRIGNTLPFTFGVRFSHLFDSDPVDNASNRFDFIVPIQQLFNY
jgi:tetratricopeptide (TPR) repeat protein